MLVGLEQPGLKQHPGLPPLLLPRIRLSPALLLSGSQALAVSALDCSRLDDWWRDAVE